jgi:transposase
MDGYLATQLLYVAAKLGIADVLASGPLAADALARYVGAELWVLPAYSPDLNSNEEAFSKVKALLKKASPRTREALVEAVRRALSAISPEDAKGWFLHCTYEAEAQGS